MEKLLIKMARQLNSLDEASLSGLWNKYLERARDFDGSSEWEEAAIVLSLIQAVRGKNHLFNARWRDLHEEDSEAPSPSPSAMRPPAEGFGDARPAASRAAVHEFRPLRGN